MSRAFLDATVTVPTGGWSVSVNDGGGADVATVPAGDYVGAFALALALRTAMNTATGQTFSISVDFDTVTCNGHVTISVVAGTFTLTWTSTDLRDYLGFTGTLSPAAATFTGTRGCQGMWLPNAPVTGVDLSIDLDGNPRSDARYSKSPTGQVLLFVGNEYKSFRGVRWSHVAAVRAIAIADTTVSFQAWVRNTQWGALSYFPIVDGVAPAVLFYADQTSAELVGAALGADGLYRLVLRPDLALARPVDGWDGLWSVEIQEMIKV